MRGPRAITLLKLRDQEIRRSIGLARFDNSARPRPLPLG